MEVYPLDNRLLMGVPFLTFLSIFLQGYSFCVFSAVERFDLELHPTVRAIHFDQSNECLRFFPFEPEFDSFFNNPFMEPYKSIGNLNWREKISLGIKKC